MYVSIDAATFRRIQLFAKTAGMPTPTAIADALNEWMDNTGEPLIDAALRLRKRRKKPSLSAPIPISVATGSFTHSRRLPQYIAQVASQAG